MDIDMAVLRMLATEREIPLEVLVKTMEDAMLLAYSKTEGAARRARVELDRKSGKVTVWALEDLEPVAEGEPRPEPREYDDTPADFGRVAASTARQVIHQRMRDLEDESVLGDFRGKEGDILSGEALASLPMDRQLVLHCKSGARSAEALAVLHKAGFADAVHVGGGVLAWVKQVDPSLPSY